MIEQINTAAELANGLSGLFNAMSSLFVGLASFIGAASVVAKFLPPPEQPGILSTIHRWINKAAMNSGYAENKIQ